MTGNFQLLRARPGEDAFCTSGNLLSFSVCTELMSISYKLYWIEVTMSAIPAQCCLHTPIYVIYVSLLGMEKIKIVRETVLCIKSSKIYIHNPHHVIFDCVCARDRGKCQRPTLV